MAKRSESKKKPYEQRTDLEKIASNWTKTIGLLDRNEYSVAVVRAAVTLELAVNFAIRREFVNRANLDADFVNHLLIWANGIRGKFTQLLIPVLRGTDRLAQVQAMFKQTKTINDHRNQVAHGGHFKSKRVAIGVAQTAHAVIAKLVKLYEPDFELDEVEDDS